MEICQIRGIFINRFDYHKALRNVFDGNIQKIRLKELMPGLISNIIFLHLFW